MARKTTIDTDTLIALTEQFYLEKCNNNPLMLKPSKIGEYIRAKGYLVQDYTIRRNKSLMEHIYSLQEKSESVYFKTVSVYRDTNIDAFINLNNTREKLRVALQEKDNYYREISRSATHIFKENKKLQADIQRLQETIVELKNEINTNRLSTTATDVDNQAYRIEIQKLKKIIDTYVYPEIANELLKKEGLLKTTGNIVDPARIESDLVSAKSTISEIKNNVIKGLFTSI